MTRAQKLGVFATLLFCVITLTLLFASGTFRFGLSGPIVYMLYFLAGLLAAMLTFGMLSSSGQLNASKGGSTLKLGGSIVALAVVTGGGGLYEKYLHQPESFDLLLKFWQDDANATVPLKGQVVLYAGNNDFSQPLDGTGKNRFLGLPASLLGHPLSISLNSPGYQVIDMNPAIYTRDIPVSIHVRRTQMFASPTADQFSIEIASAQVVDFGPRPDQRIVTVILIFQSQATLPVPLTNVARLQIFTETGAPIWTADLKSDRPFVVADPGLSSETFEASIDRSKLDMLKGGRLAQFTLKSEPSVHPPAETSYVSAIFPISPATFQDLSNPSK